MNSHCVEPIKITVSPAGIMNGLSSIPNGGCRFGPDSNNYGQTTRTNGITEAIEYTETSLNEMQIELEPGVYYLTEDVKLESDLIIGGIEEEITLIVILGSCSRGFYGVGNHNFTIRDLQFMSESKSIKHAPRSCLHFHQEEGNYSVHMLRVGVQGIYQGNIIEVHGANVFVISDVVIVGLTLREFLKIDELTLGNLIINVSISEAPSRISRILFKVRTLFN